jgi:hypothetical protein
LQEEKHNSENYSWFGPSEEDTNENSLKNKCDYKHEVNKEEYFESDTGEDVFDHDDADDDYDEEEDHEVGDEPGQVEGSVGHPHHFHPFPDPQLLFSQEFLHQANKYGY